MITHRARLVSMGALLVLFFFVVFPVGVFAQSGNPLDQACVGNAAGTPACDTPTTNPIVGPDGLVTRATTILASVTVVIAVIIIIVAGLTMTLSSGNSGKVQQSRDAIIYAAVAIGVAALARVIVVFVVTRVQ